MFQVPSIITKIITMRDKSLRLYVDTQELSAPEKALVFSLHEQPGYFIFKKSEIHPEDLQVPDYVPEFKSDKSPSQRLRGVLFKIWELSSKGSFDDFYKSEMEKIINHYKTKLE